MDRTKPGAPQDGRVPRPARAEAMLKEAAALNPGPWETHSRVAAQAAMQIAARCNGLDAERAFVLGLLHDIGRRCGRYENRHLIDGHRYLIDAGLPGAARVCITHAFLLPRMDSLMGAWDCSADEYRFVEEFLKEVVYDDYDRLIQLCDFLAGPTGFVVAEKRMVDVALRYGQNPYMLDKWRTALNIKTRFDEMAGVNVYEILPGICENTLSWRVTSTRDPDPRGT